jgi:hypothetical protein
MSFLLVVGCLIVVRNLFFPQTVLEPARALENVSGFLLLFQARALIGASVLALYFYSYLKDWHFERVGFLITGMTFTIFIRDFLTYFVLNNIPLTPLTVFDILIRACVFACFLLNALRDNRAPSMPRTLWS